MVPQISHVEGAVLAYFFSMILNVQAPNKMQICPTRKLVLVMCHKGAGTKMQKCLFGSCI